MRQRIKPWYKKGWVVIIIIILSFLLMGTVSIGLLFYENYKKIKSGELPVDNALLANTDLPSKKIPAELIKKIEGRGNYWLGAEEPKITIVVFGDFACPACKSSFPKIREISHNYQEQVKIIFRDYPLLTDYSFNLARAGRCAGEQKLFWPMHDILYINQGLLNNKQLTSLAGRIGANTDLFSKCLESEKYEQLIYQDISDGTDLGIEGTPTWFIEGYKITGDIPRDLFLEIIEKLLNEKAI